MKLHRLGLCQGFYDQQPSSGTVHMLYMLQLSLAADAVRKLTTDNYEQYYKYKNSKHQFFLSTCLYKRCLFALIKAKFQ